MRPERYQSQWRLRIAAASPTLPMSSKSCEKELSGQVVGTVTVLLSTHSIHIPELLCIMAQMDQLLICISLLPGTAYIYFLQVPPAFGVGVASVSNQCCINPSLPHSVSVHSAGELTAVW